MTAPTMNVYKLGGRGGITIPQPSAIHSCNKRRLNSSHKCDLGEPQELGDEQIREQHHFLKSARKYGNPPELPIFSSKLFLRSDFNSSLSELTGCETQEAGRCPGPASAGPARAQSKPVPGNPQAGLDAEPAEDRASSPAPPRPGLRATPGPAQRRAPGSAGRGPSRGPAAAGVQLPAGAHPRARPGGGARPGRQRRQVGGTEAPPPHRVPTATRLGTRCRVPPTRGRRPRLPPRVAKTAAARAPSPRTRRPSPQRGAGAGRGPGRRRRLPGTHRRPGAAGAGRGWRALAGPGLRPGRSPRSLPSLRGCARKASPARTLEKHFRGRGAGRVWHRNCSRAGADRASRGAGPLRAAPAAPPPAARRPS